MSCDISLEFLCSHAHKAVYTVMNRKECVLLSATTNALMADVSSDFSVGSEVAFRTFCMETFINTHVEVIHALYLQQKLVVTLMLHGSYEEVSQVTALNHWVSTACLQTTQLSSYNMQRMLKC